jgi:hypothetical protein
MEAYMDYTVLTAVHPRRLARVQMDAKQEQDYYERAAASQALPEKMTFLVQRARHLARTLLTLTHSTQRNFGHGLTRPNASS